MELVMFEKFLKGYVEAAVFTNGSVVAPIDDETMKEIETDCRGFYDSNFDRIKDAPEKAGVDFLQQSRVESMRPGEVVVSTPDGEKCIRAATVIWTAGVRASHLGHALEAATGCSLDRGGQELGSVGQLDARGVRSGFAHD